MISVREDVEGDKSYRHSTSNKQIIEAGRYSVAVGPRVFYAISGSSVLVFLYDSIKKIGGVAHAQLPNSSEATTKIFNEGKYIDTAILAVINDMVGVGAKEENLSAKIVGGSNRLDGIDIGPRNITAAKDTLAKLGIEILGEDTGGKFGRHVEFYTEQGAVVSELMLGDNELVRYL